MAALYEHKLQWIIVSLAVCFMAQFSCRSSVLKRVVAAEENSYVDIRKNNSGLIRSVFCDVYIEHIDAEKWEKLLKFKVYAGETLLLTRYQVPPLEFMHFIIRNTSNYPLVIKEVCIEGERGTIPSLTSHDIERAYRSHLYSVFDFDALYSPRRLTAAHYAIDDIRYESETIGYNFGFIAQGDTVLFVRAFEWIPASMDRFSVVITVKAGGVQRTIRFPMRRYLYRRGGPDFREPEREDEEFLY